MEESRELSLDNTAKNLFGSIFSTENLQALQNFFAEPLQLATLLSSPKKTYSGKYRLLSPFETQKDRTYRFIVDEHRKLWFAPEGLPSMTTPAHYQMTGESYGNARCIAAGNIKMRSDGRVMIKNKSGNFLPPPTSLLHFFAAVYSGKLAEKLGLSNTIEVELWRTAEAANVLKGFLFWPEIRDWFEQLDEAIIQDIKQMYQPESKGMVRDYTLRYAANHQTGRMVGLQSFFRIPEPYLRQAFEREEHLSITAVRKEEDSVAQPTGLALESVVYK